MEYGNRRIENLREQLNRIEEEIGDLRETRRKTIESIDTFNGKNSQGKIIKLEGSVRDNG